MRSCLLLSARMVTGEGVGPAKQACVSTSCRQLMVEHAAPHRQSSLRAHQTLGARMPGQGSP